MTFFSFLSVIPVSHVYGSNLKHHVPCPACSAFSNTAHYMQYPLGTCWEWFLWVFPCWCTQDNWWQLYYCTICWWYYWLNNLFQLFTSTIFLVILLSFSPIPVLHTSWEFSDCRLTLVSLLKHKQFAQLWISCVQIPSYDDDCIFSLKVFCTPFHCLFKSYK